MFVVGIIIASKHCSIVRRLLFAMRNKIKMIVMSAMCIRKQQRHLVHHFIRNNSQQSYFKNDEKQCKGIAK